MTPKRIIRLILLILGIAAVAMTLEFSKDADPLPSFQDVRSSYRVSDALLLDRHGTVIHEFRVDPDGRRLEWVSLRDISPALVKAVVLAEDRRFYRHRGVDWPSLVTGFSKGLAFEKPRGASTISMQLAAKIDGRLKPRKSRRTWQEKWRQIRAAQELERHWKKDEILEAYLNLITFRGELQGIAAAARGLFNKEPSGLDETESLILASLIPSNKQSVDLAVRRACTLARQGGMGPAAEEIQAVASDVLGRPYHIRPRISLAPHVARMLLTGDNNRVFSTLDGSLQTFVLESLNHHLLQLRERNVHDGAVLVVDNATGDILAYAGNSGNAASALYTDAVKAARQAGSTLKPFLYAMALERRILTAASVLDDSPLQIATPTGLYVPENYSTDFLGPVSLRTALSSSLNIPAVRTLTLVGVDSFVDKLRALGFESIHQEGDYYGFSLALGSVDITLHDLTNAYRTMANQGMWSPLRLTMQKKSGTPLRVIEDQSAFIVSSILSDREARSATFGLENPLATTYWTAVKTGTSKDMRDNWCVGYSGTYTVGVWVGNFSGESMWNVTGISGAAPIWLEIMNELHRRTPSSSPNPPPGLTAKEVRFTKGIETPRIEWFIQGTEPNKEVAAVEGYEVPRIIHPANGSVISLDPDIPEDRQAVTLRARPAERTFEWRLNNKTLGPATPLLWKPERGDYVLSLIDRNRRVLDSVRFAVK